MQQFGNMTYKHKHRQIVSNGFWIEKFLKGTVAKRLRIDNQDINKTNRGESVVRLRQGIQARNEIQGLRPVQGRVLFPLQRAGQTLRYALTAHAVV